MTDTYVRKLLIAGCFVAGVAGFQAEARDVAAQQAAYNSALKKFEQAEEQYKYDQETVVDLQKDIERRQQQLAAAQKKLDVSKARYTETKSSLDQAQDVLDKAWKQ